MVESTGRSRHRRAPISALVRRARGRRTQLVDSIARVNRRLASGAVALTFDDGPQPGSTDLVLDLLAELDVRATFFCVGKNARAYPELVRRMRSEGHAVGSHSLTHPHPAETSLGRLATEYADGREALAEALGTDTPLFRPPHGHLSPGSAVVLRRQGLVPWLWTVDPEDWRPGVTRQVIEETAGQAQAGDVVLLHDWIEQPWAPEALDRSATLAALPAIVAQVRARGLVFVRLSP